MSRSLGIAATFALLLAGCAPTASNSPSFFRVELPSIKEGRDRDIVPTSLRSEPATVVAKLPKVGDRRGVALRLKNNYARLQFLWPLLPRSMPMRLTMIARSFWVPSAIGTPRGKFLLRFALPLSSPPQRDEPSASPLHMMDRGFLATSPDSLVIDQRLMSASVPGDRSTLEDDLFDVWLTDFDMVLPADDRS